MNVRSLIVTLVFVNLKIKFDEYSNYLFVNSRITSLDCAISIVVIAVLQKQSKHLLVRNSSNAC